jgi:hypothetical protein
MPKRPTGAFTATMPDGENVVADTNRVYADDHWLVVTFPANFREIELDIIESATNAPGERRNVRRP